MALSYDTEREKKKRQTPITHTHQNPTTTCETQKSTHILLTRTFVTPFRNPGRVNTHTNKNKKSKISLTLSLHTITIHITFFFIQRIICKGTFCKTLSSFFLNSHTFFLDEISRQHERNRGGDNDVDGENDVQKNRRFAGTYTITHTTIIHDFKKYIYKHRNTESTPRISTR